jgi:predicted DsbA family dithiol-disulfide isomerase
MSVSKFDIVTINSPRTNELSQFWAEALGLQGTPTVVMDRQFLPGAVTAEVLEQQLAELGRSK